MRPTPNLLPRKLLLRRSRRVRIRHWAMVLTLEAILGGVAGLVSRYDYSNPATEARQIIESTIGQIDVVSTALASTQRELQSVQQKLAVASEVAEQPDWSIVLSAIAWRGQGLVTLTTAQLLAPVSDPDTGSMLHRLTLLGSGEARSDVTRFVERLEASGIFSQVRISQTQIIPNPTAEDPDAERVGFTIVAWLTDEGTP